MVINKIGQQHIDFGTNCQDYGFENLLNKVVCDGCSEGLHSEVGAKAFSHLFSRYSYESDTSFASQIIFDRYLLNVFGQTDKSIKNYLCFTIMRVYESPDAFTVSYCGDGYIILQKTDGEIVLEEINDGEFPKYYAYNYANKEHLKYYKEGVEFTSTVFYKDTFTNVGIASDGLRFIDKDPEHRGEFIELLKQGKEAPLKRFINKHQSIFKDDITIVF